MYHTFNFSIFNLFIVSEIFEIIVYISLIRSTSNDLYKNTLALSIVQNII